MITYENCILPYKHNYIKIIIPDEKVHKIKEFIKELIKEKEKEKHHLCDNKSHFKRYLTGFLGEAALEEFFGTEGIIDWTIGNSEKYHNPDLKSLGVNAGIKTVEYGLFPIVFKKSFSDEVIMIKVSDNHVVLCGIAKKSVLNEFQSDELIKDSNLRKRGTKTGFYGFEHLQRFSSLDELRLITRT